MPEKPEVPEEPQWSRPPIEEGPKQRPTGAESTPGGVGAPLGTETYETQPLPALDALLQTNFMEDLKVKGLKDLQPHVESHEPFGDDRMLAFGPLYIHDVQYAEYTKAGMADADGNTVLFTLGAYNSALSFGLSLARNVTDRAGAFLDHFNANVWDPVFMNISRVHTGTPGVQPDMDEGSVSRLAMREHDIIEVRRLEFQDTDQSAGNDISVQQRGDAAGAILEIVSNNDATQYSSPTYRRLRLADPVGADDAATKRYVDALSYAGHALLDGSLHTDTLAAGVTDGSIVIGNVTPKWSELVIAIPAANVRNVLGIDNAELRPSWKTALDATNPAGAGGAASPGTSLVFSHRDHVHAVDASHSGSAHHNAITIGADAAHSLVAQVLWGVLAANGQTGHMSGTMFDALVANVAKLAGIEATADVTDAANVAGAGAVMDSDIAPAEGFLRKTGAGAYTAHKSNLAAAAAPVAADDDADAGYSVGSLWIDTTNDNIYTCVDSTNNAAVWLHLNAAAAAHDHTGAADGGVLTNDKHDGYSEYAEIAIPSAPAAGKGEVFTALLTGNDSLTPGTDETGLYYRRSDGLMTKISDDYPYSVKMRYVNVQGAGSNERPYFANNWVNYGVANHPAYIMQDFLGCVWAGGMIKSGTINQDAFAVPEGMRNTGGSLRWATVANDLFADVDYISTHAAHANAGSNTWYSLHRMAWPATDRITWHEVNGGVGFANSWVDYAAGGWDTAGYAKDALGRVWIKGLVKDGTDNAVIFTLPAGYRPTADIMTIGVTAADVIADLKILADGSVIVNILGAGTNAWASVACMFTADGEGPGWTAVSFEGTWADFGGAYDTGAYYKDAAGIVHIKGLIKDGTIATTAFTLPVGMRPRSDVLMAAESNSGVMGRLSIRHDGLVVPSVGNNTYFSVHASFPAEQ